MATFPTQPLQIAPDKSTTNQAYQSALRAAVNQGDASATRTILSRLPADFTPDEFTIRRAVYIGPISVLEALLAYDCNLANTVFDNHGTPLSLALQSKRPLSTIRLLLSHGADPNTDPDTLSSSLCLAACCYDDPAVVGLLLEHGVSMRDSWALSAAACAGKLNVVRYLLARGFNPDGDPADREKATRRPPLHLAVERRDDAICEALLSAGADPMLKDGKGRSAIDVARKAGREKVFEAWFPEAAAMSERAIV